MLTSAVGGGSSLYWSLSAQTNAHDACTRRTLARACTEYNQLGCFPAQRDFRRPARTEPLTG
eukprot:3130057-Pyramimonas_sp.AAC.1